MEKNDHEDLPIDLPSWTLMHPLSWLAVGGQHNNLDEGIQEGLSLYESVSSPTPQTNRRQQQR